MRAGLLFGSGFIFWLIGWLNDSYAAYLVGACSFALLLLCYLWAAAAARGFDCRATGPSHATAGQPATLQWRCRNRSRFCRSVLVELVAENVTTQEPFVSRRVLELQPRLAEGAFTEGIAFPVRGRYDARAGLAYVTDPMGVFRRSRRAQGPGHVLVYPFAEALPKSDWQMFSSLRGSETRATPVPSDVGEYYGIRPYALGDDLRRVHWKATAHTGALAVKEYEQYSSTCHVLMIELAAFAHRGTGSRSSLEAAVNAAASVSTRVLESGRALGLVAIGSQRLVIAPDRGHQQFLRTMEALAVMKADGEAPLAQLLSSAAIAVPAGSTSMIVASSAAPSLAQAVCAMRTRGSNVVVILIAAHTFDQTPRQDPAEEEDFNRMLSALSAFTTVYPVRRGEGLASAMSGAKAWL